MDGGNSGAADGHRRLREDLDELEARGIHVQTVGVVPADDGDGEVLEVELVAPNERQAIALMRERYGDRTQVQWLGPTWLSEEAIAWSRCEVIDERTLAITYSGTAGCESGRVYVEETHDAVIVTAYENCPPSPKPFTPTQRQVRAALKAPLGARRVRDGSQR